MLVENMTWEEYGDEVGRRIIILPVGSLEQHRPHLPLKTNVVISRGLTISVFPPPDDIIPKSGVLYKATYASREKGEKLAKQVVGTVVQIVRQEFGS